MGSETRRRVYRTKTKWEYRVIARRFKLLQPHMILRLKDELDSSVGLEQPSMDELTVKGVPADQWPYYMGFAKRMLQLYRHFSGWTLGAEKQSLINEFVERGLDQNVLLQLQDVVDDYWKPLCLAGYVREFRDYFASGDFSRWDQADDVHLVADPVYTLPYAVRSIATPPEFGYLYKQIQATPKIHTVRYIRFVDLSGAGSTILEDYSNDRVNYHGGLFIYCPGATPGNFRLVLQDYLEGPVWHEGTIILNDHVWYKVEIEWEQGLAGRKRLWLDGVLDVDFVADGLAMDINSFEVTFPRTDFLIQYCDDYLICRI